VIADRISLLSLEAATVGDVAAMIKNLVMTSLLAFAPAALADVTPSASSGAWQGLRATYYGTKEIGEVDEKLMSVAAPASTPDPSATPVTIRFGAQTAGKVKQVRLIIDHNPSPVAATLQLEQGVPIDEIELRIRVDRATSVRAVAELSDGSLEMRSAWVNASGGCSSPPSPANGGTLGDIRFRPGADGKALQMSIRHPNNSGFQIDPVSGDAIPPHFVLHVRLRSGEQTLLDADTGISLSENPTVRIASERSLSAPLTLEAVDSKNQHYEATWNGGASQKSGGR
jgi:sulfur-oxidizing protein SoxY